MLFVDLDRFKSVNDSLGHARGDQLLVMVANRLRVVVTAETAGRPSTGPCSARLAGDEFTIFLPRIASSPKMPSGSRAASRWRSANRSSCHGHSIDIGASIGVASAPDHGTSIEALMRAADIAMYHAKERAAANIACSRPASPPSTSALDTEARCARRSSAASSCSPSSRN